MNTQQIADMNDCHNLKDDSLISITRGFGV